MNFNKAELELLVGLLDMARTDIAEVLQSKLQEKLNKAKEYDLCLWDFHWDYGRQGDVEGRFKATKEQMNNILGNTISFGEILGKYSDVVNTLDDNDLTLVSDDPFVVMEAECSGYDPFDYWTCEQCGYPLNPYTGKCDNCIEGEE